MNKEAFLGKVIDGIPHGILVADLEKKGENIILGLSGKTRLRYLSDGVTRFRLEDNLGFHTVGCSVDRFGQFRAIARTVYLENGERVHHHDLFAGQLLNFFIQKIQEADPEMPKVIRDQWGRPLPREIFTFNNNKVILEDNFAQYQEGLKRGMSGPEAALSTWSGKFYSSLGFTVENRGIEESGDVYVSFRRG